MYYYSSSFSDELFSIELTFHLNRLWYSVGMHTYTKEIIGIVALLIAGIVVFFLATLAPETPMVLPEDGVAPGGQQVKINIDEVCASALTYMTFTDGAAAEAFIQECKEGKHPDVIERYFEQMGVPNGATI